MKPNRRGFLQVLGGTALAGRKVAEETARKLIGVHIGSGTPLIQSLGNTLKEEGFAGPIAQSGTDHHRGIVDWQRLRNKAVEAALADKQQRRELESILYRRYRNVYQLDPDLACNKSFSMAAKLAYQRQRLVENELDRGLEDNKEWHDIQSWRDKVLRHLSLPDWLVHK